MTISPITIREPTIAALIDGRCTRLWRAPGQISAARPGDRLWVREPYHLAEEFDFYAPTVAITRGATPYFAADLASGRIQWRTADLDTPEHAHFVDEFGLYTKSVVLVRLEGGKQIRFDSLSRIWELVYDKEAYIAYIREEVQGFLDSPKAPA